MNTLTDAQRDRVLAYVRDGRPLRGIETMTGHRRETIAAYARRAGLREGSGAPAAVPDIATSVCSPHHETIARRVARGDSLSAIYADLVACEWFAGSYGALKHYARTWLNPADLTLLMAA